MTSELASRVVASIRTCTPVIAGALVLFGASGVHAQSAQKYAFQVALLGTSIDVGNAGNVGGVGIEPQVRYNRLVSNEKYAVSLGAGLQYTTHTSGPDNLKISGLFVEPRFAPVVGSTTFFPYLAGRLAMLNQSSNFGTSSGGYAAGAGAGVVIKLTKTVNIDAGGALVRQKFGDFRFNGGASGSFRPFTTYAIKAGVNFGFPK